MGNGFIALGDEVKMGSRTANNEKALTWSKALGPKATTGTFTDAAQFGDLTVLATLGLANESALHLAGRLNFVGKVVIDATNPLDLSTGFPPKLALSGTDSGGEQTQRLLPGAFVVKAFNTVGNAHMFKPSFPGGPPDMFLCGNDASAKQKVADVLEKFGWGAIDLGGIESSRYLEALCMAWVLHAAATGSYNHAFKILHK